MVIERVVLFVAGMMVFLSSALAYYHHPYWLILTAFVGANLMFSSLTKFCPLVIILRKLGFKHGQPF